MLNYGRQTIDELDIKAVVNVLNSPNLTQGPAVLNFERAIGEKVGAAHVVAVNSATSALHLACLALDVQNGDSVWTSPISFVASANCAIYCGANIDFVDIDPKTFNISIQALKVKLEVAKRKNTLPKVLIPVHFAGLPCDLEALSELAKIYKFKIIEDASHAIGSIYFNSPIGSCKYSDITVFSFHPVKIITTGEGGAALTQDINLANKMRLLRSHGITRDHDIFSNKEEGPWYYEQIALGFNFRITDIQAALGIEQLKKIDEFIEERNRLASNYKQLLSGLPVKMQMIPSGIKSSYHLFVVRFDLNKFNRLSVYQNLLANNIVSNVHYIPIYRQPFFKTRGFLSSSYIESESYYQEALTLPLFPGLTDSEQIKIVEVIKDSAITSSI